MTNNILFDRLAYIDRLTRAGISDDHARAHADAMGEALREGVATRHDLLALEHRLTVRGGLMATAAVAILASLKFFG
jgi:hypothetical protein